MKIKRKALLYIFIVMAVAFIVSNYEPKPELTNIIITAETKILEDQIYQRYHVGENEICQKDCKFYSKQNDAEYHSAIVRVWGQCNCRFLI